MNWFAIDPPIEREINHFIITFVVARRLLPLRRGLQNDLHWDILSLGISKYLRRVSIPPQTESLTLIDSRS